MPIRISDNLPAFETLEKEHIFVMRDTVAYKQQIRPLKILILNFSFRGRKKKSFLPGKR